VTEPPAIVKWLSNGDSGPHYREQAFPTLFAAVGFVCEKLDGFEARTVAIHRAGEPPLGWAEIAAFNENGADASAKASPAEAARQPVGSSRDATPPRFETDL